MHYKYFIASIGLKADLVLTRLALGFATAAAAAFRAVINNTSDSKGNYSATSDNTTAEPPA